MIHCLHGAVGHHSNWELFKDTLPQPLHHHNLWSFFQNSSPSLSEAAKLINTQAAQHDILLGYSMGGRIALHTLLAQPQKWKAAIIISAHPGLEKHRTERLAQDEKWAQLALTDWPNFIHQWNSQSILSSVTPTLKLAPSSDQAAVAHSFLHWSLGTQKNLRPLLKKITTPLLWITGENDPKFTTLAQDCAPLLPNCTHTTLPDCGHRAPWESPTAFTQTVKTFLTPFFSHPSS